MFVIVSVPAVGDEKVYRLGELGTATSLGITRAETLPELAKLGFSEGRNLFVDERAGDAPATLPALARELLLGKPDAIIAIGHDAIRAMRDATHAVPIVMFGTPPEGDFAGSLARPVGNVTGVVILATLLDGKRLDLLHEAVPAARRVAALTLPPPWSSTREDSVQAMRAVAANAEAELLVFDAAGPDDYAAAFAAMRSAGAEALVIGPNPYFNRDAGLLARHALAAGLPTICEWDDMAKSGCLLGYGPDRVELRRRVAHYVARIFHGVAPGELPIETPTRFVLAINLKTAEALGLTILPSLLARADEVIE
jgi:putative ABC transport system substrate-binding protein